MNNVISIISDVDKERIDIYISKNTEDISRNSVQKLIEEGNVTVNGKMIKSNYKTKIGDIIEIAMPKPQLLNVEAEDMKLEIVYEDCDIAIINKPQGMVVHPAPGHFMGTLVNGLMYQLNGLSTINGIMRPGIVHRLDKNTSGLMIVAKNDVAHNILAESLKEHTIDRIYYALVDGNVKVDSGTIDEPIGRNEKDRKKRAVTNKNSKEAVTNFWVIRRYKNYTLLKLKLETGRTHQIRVHMKYIGHPVVGDDVYGRAVNKFGVKGQLLHSKTLGLIHPSKKEYMEFNSELPKYFKDIIEILNNMEGYIEN